MMMTTRRKINKDRLLWLDLETTGLEAESNAILEIAAVITDFDLRTIDQLTMVISQPETVLEQMDQWCQEQHKKSGLIDLVRESEICLEAAEMALIRFVEHNETVDAALCGNSIQFDRKFTERHMPRLYELFHYRNIDTSTLVLMSHVCHLTLPEKGDAHRARADIFESIAVARTFRNRLVKAVAA